MSNYLKLSEIGLEPARPFPGKWYRTNPRGTIEFENKSEWVENEALKWFNIAKEHPKYDQTPIGKKTSFLVQHLRKMKIASSEARKLIVKLEECNIPIEESDVNDDEADNLEEHADIEDMELVETVETVDEMETEEMDASQDMFADNDSTNPDGTLTRSEKDKIINEAMLKPIEELIESEDNLPEFVAKSYKYTSLKFEHINNYVENEFEGKSSQEILNVFSQTPGYVVGSDVYKQRLNHLSHHERSEKRIFKNVNDTLSILKQSGTPEALEHRKIIASAVYDPKFGFPKINETRDVKNAGRELKTKLRSGEKTDLKPEQRNSTDYYPQSVKDIAETCWRTNCTVIEPGKHTRPKAAIKDGSETIPIIYQTLTDKEAYSAFQEIYQDDVNNAIKVDCQLLMDKLRNISDSTLKEKKRYSLRKKKINFQACNGFYSRNQRRQKPVQTTVQDSARTVRDHRSTMTI